MQQGLRQIRRGPQPGEEFLLVRLKRAQAVPAAQRCGEVAAFVESMRLEEAVADLLPLGATSVDSPALPFLRVNTSAAAVRTGERVLQALAHLARITYLCGEAASPGGLARFHVRPYLERGCPPACPPARRCLAEMPELLQKASSSSTATVVATVLWCFGVACVYEEATSLAAHGGAAAALRRAGSCRQAGLGPGAARPASRRRRRPVADR